MFTQIAHPRGGLTWFVLERFWPYECLSGAVGPLGFVADWLVMVFHAVGDEGSPAVAFGPGPVSVDCSVSAYSDTSVVDFWEPVPSQNVWVKASCSRASRAV